MNRTARGSLPGGDEGLKRFKSGLAGLRRSRRFVPWSRSREVAVHLESLLDELRSSGCDPQTGADLTGKFFECDDSVLGRCDDSSGIIGDVFRMTARDLWVDFAARCEDSGWILDRVFGLVGTDDYGVRDCLLEAAPEYLDESAMRSLADRLWEEGQKAANSRHRNRWYLQAGTIARALKDPALYEKATVAWCGGSVGGLSLSIAEVYLEAGSPTGALRWLERQPEGPRYREDDHDRLLLRAYELLGSGSGQLEVALRLFERSPSVQRLDQLVGVAGASRRTEFVEGVIARAADGPLDLVSVEFLLEVGQGQAADGHLIAHRDELNGDLYPTLLRLAAVLEPQGFLLSTVCLYRALLDSILKRAKSKNYGHGVRYLKKLDALAFKVVEWRQVEPHVSYRTRLLERHRLKRSFWSKVTGGR